MTTASLNSNNTATSHSDSSYSTSTDQMIPAVPDTISPVWGDWNSIPSALSAPAGAFVRSAYYPTFNFPPVGNLNGAEANARQGVAQASNTFDSENKSNGKSTNTAGTLSTSFSFSASQTTKNAASQSASSAYSFSVSGATASMNTSGTAYAIAEETDTSSGTNDNGAVQGTSKNWGDEQRQTSGSSVYDGTQTVGAPGSTSSTSNHNTTSTENFRMTSFTKAGGYSTTAGNPSGSMSASYNETTTIDDNVNNWLSITQTFSGSTPTTSDSWSGTYTGLGESSIHSKLTVAFDPATNANTRSGDYNASAWKTGNASLTETGGVSAAMGAKINWKYDHVINSNSSVTDAGTYSNPQQDGSLTRYYSTYDVAYTTKTMQFWDFAIGGWTPAYTTTTKRDMSSSPTAPPTAQPDGMSGNPQPANPAAGSTGGNASNAPWYDDSWADWFNPFAYGAAAYYRMKDAIVGLHEFFTTDNYAYWGNVRGKMNDLNAKMADPNSRMTIGEYQDAQRSLRAEAALNVIEDAGKFVNGIMAITELAGWTKVAFKAGMGLANLGAQAMTFVRNEGLPNTLRYAVNRTSCILFNGGACFAAGTPILTPGGAKPIEAFQRGDTVYSRPDGDPHGPVRIGAVDAIFERSTHIWEVHVGGKVIQTTGEHPFYVVGHGWTPANRLEAGDRLLGHNERHETVERVVQTNRTATVYNMRVESDHTYFVGEDEWGFSVWAHNANYAAPAAANVAKGGIYVLKDAARNVVRSGRTNNLARRALEHATQFKNLTFEVVYRTDIYAVQRGLEKVVHDTYLPILNKILPISPKNANLDTYTKAAAAFLEML